MEKSIHSITQEPPIRSANIALIGCGAWGSNHARALAELGFLRSVVDTDAARAAEIGRAVGVPSNTLDIALGDATVAGVVISAPAEQHYRLARQALEAGKHVLVEKPLALDVAEAEELCAMAADRGRVLMVGHLLQYHPAFLALKALVNEGVLGRLQYIYSTRLNFGRVRREENILWSFAPHDISMILALVGERPDSVQAVGSSYLHKVIADVTTTHLSFPNGVNAHIFVSWLHPFKEQRLVVVGENGMAVFDDGAPWERKLVRYPHRIDWINGVPSPSRADALPVALVPEEPLKLELEHFMECMTTGRQPRTDGGEGSSVLRVLTEAQRAMDGNRTSTAFAEPKPPRPSSHPAAMIHSSAVVDEGVVIGPGTRVWHFSHLLSGVRVGARCVIGQNVMIGPDVSVGDGCKIQNNVSLYKGVTLEDEVFCGPSCVFTNVNTPRAGIERKNEFLPTLVKRGATIGANATVVCGTTLGEYSFVAAGAVVTKDVPPFALVAGIPARRIGWVSRTGERLGDDLVCPRTGERYALIGPDRLERIPG